MVKTRIRTVQDAEPIFARRHLKIWRKFSVNQNTVAENFWNPRSIRLVRDRIKKLAFRSKQAVGNQQRNFEFAPGEIQRILNTVANYIAAKQPRINLQAITTHRVVVI